MQDGPQIGLDTVGPGPIMVSCCCPKHTAALVTSTRRDIWYLEARAHHSPTQN